MFQNLNQRLSTVFKKLRGQGALSEADVLAALREIRIALLEADVALPVVKDFIEAVKAKAIGQEVLRSITPAQMVVKIVHDHLIEMLGSAATPLNLAAQPPVVYLMVGLQGSGKTTTTAKLARFLSTKERKKVLMASLDTYRPAAQDQLEILGKSINVATLPILREEKPIEITKRALKAAKLEGYDVLLLDTAGRLHLDDVMMQEVQAIKKLANPLETLLIADAMTGQDAVNIAKSFMESVGLTGLILTRIDGDARGGAALSMRAVTNVPIKFVGMGEKVDQLEIFYPDRIASRILDMGDIVSLVEKAAEMVDHAEAERLAKRTKAGLFDLNDMADHLKKFSKMGGMSQMLGMLPGMQNIKEKIKETGVDDKMIGRQLAIISSMTRQERKNYKLLNASRKVRIAKGSGMDVSEINRLLKQYQQMSTMMKRVGKLGKKGLLRQGLKGLFS